MQKRSLAPAVLSNQAGGRFSLQGVAEMADEQKVGETPKPPEQPAETAQAESTLTAEQYKEQLAEAQKRLREVNRESAERRKRLEALETAEAERKSAEMTEAQKLQAKIDAIQKEKDAAVSKANSALVRAAVTAKAAGKFYDVEDVYLALRDKLTVNSDGDIDGLDDALAELVKAKPHWVKSDKPTAPKLSATAPGGNASAPGETDAERRARIYGGGGHIFEKNTGVLTGGGVIVTDK